MYFLKREPRIDFLGRRGLAGIVSAVLIVIGIVSLGVRGLAFGIDFTGGTLVEVAYEESVEASSVRDLIANAGFESALVQYFGTSKDILVRLPASAIENAAQVSSRIMVALRSPYKETLVTAASGDLQQCLSDNGTSGRCAVQMRRVEFVGPQVGEELTEKGGLAMLYALLGILIYVSWRFEWRFAIGAVAALVHDVLITVGVFSVLGLEFSLPVLAAILAIIGYSLNDTIVVFDRVRENFRKMRRGTPTEIMNTSVNQTLSRTILTSLTTLLVVLTLLIIGGEVINGFATALLVGVLIGTYSSIFIANPAVLVLGISREDMLPVKKEGAEADTLP
ncbi:MAG: protein translocase subunit SecF [Arenicellales bacterium]|jgi:preprotein translocase subunit SecF|nr:protein translocase subunit SecF [Arenicellales bacterium]